MGSYRQEAGWVPELDYMWYKKICPPQESNMYSVVILSLA